MKPILNMLVVDDEPDMAPLFRQWFRREIRTGTVVMKSSTSGPDALETLRDFHKEIPLVILSDINMPGMDGIELLQIIRREYPELTVYMVSAYSDNPAYVQAAHTHGAKAFIPKPIDFRELKAQLLGG